MSQTILAFVRLLRLSLRSFTHGEGHIHKRQASALLRVYQVPFPLPKMVQEVHCPLLLSPTEANHGWDVRDGRLRETSFLV